MEGTLKEHIFRFLLTKTTVHKHTTQRLLQKAFPQKSAHYEKSALVSIPTAN